MYKFAAILALLLALPFAASAQSNLTTPATAASEQESGLTSYIETGGECMSGAESGKPESGTAATAGIVGRPCRTTGARCFEPMSDELLRAER